MYSRNIAALLQHLTKDGALNVDLADEITKGCCVTHAGQVLFGTPPPPAEQPVGAAAAPGSRS